MKKNTIVMYVLVAITVFSIGINLILVSRYTKEKNKTKYINKMINGIHDSVKFDNIEMLEKVAVDRPDKYWQEKINEIRSKKGKRAKIDNYLIIKYDNQETLIIKLTEDTKNYFYISDMFFLKDSDNSFLRYNRR
ncbi:MAG: hypothetical protein FH751_14255 [Firmicutes bacterium]|nr:hypothetical protein [Bacillota bacterium]